MGLMELHFAAETRPAATSHSHDMTTKTKRKTTEDADRKSSDEAKSVESAIPALERNSRKLEEFKLHLATLCLEDCRSDGRLPIRSCRAH